MRDRGDLLEWAQVHGNFYGTPRKPVEQALARGEDMMFDIDWQGTRQIVEKMRADAVTVFILPPSMEELKARLERRAEDTPEVIARRLRNAREEIAQWEAYDYVLVNDDLEPDLRRAQGDPRRGAPAARAPGRARTPSSTSPAPRRSDQVCAHALPRASRPRHWRART